MPTFYISYEMKSAYVLKKMFRRFVDLKDFLTTIKKISIKSWEVWHDKNCPMPEGPEAPQQLDVRLSTNVNNV